MRTRVGGVTRICVQMHFDELAVYHIVMSVGIDSTPSFVSTSNQCRTASYAKRSLAQIAQKTTRENRLLRKRNTSSRSLRGRARSSGLHLYAQKSDKC